MRVLVIKDQEGMLRPGAGIWSAENEIIKKVAKDEWKANLSKKKSFQGCTLVEATLEEIA